MNQILSRIGGRLILCFWNFPFTFRFGFMSAILLSSSIIHIAASSSNVPVMQIKYSGSQTVNIAFQAAKLTSYTILYSDSLMPANWHSLKQIAASPVDIVVNETDSVLSGKQRYYRLQQSQVIIPNLISILPSSNASNIVVNTTIEMHFSAPVSTMSTNPIRLVDDLGRSVNGLFAWATNNTVLSFIPTLPLAHNSTYTILTDLHNGYAQMVTNRWLFQTAVSKPLIEDRTVYMRDTLDVLEIHIRTLPVPGGYTLDDINNDTDTQDNITPGVDVIFSEGSYGAGLTTANGYLELRGQTTRLTDQKSYKVTLKKSGGLWRGLRTINLNKHPYDLSRVRNKICFDLFEGIPHMTSLRTQFVHVFIDDKDYGLFTQIENPDSRFLEAHGLDANGHLYKATYFEFYRYADTLRPKSDPQYNVDEFEKILEIKGNDNHEKLLAMLDDLNNDDIDINRIIEKYFNRDNYLTWLACNILTGNLDTSSQNFLLYSPKNDSTWYFMPWDYDGALGFYNQPDQKNYVLARWQQGLANWWGAVLHKRFIMDPENIADLSKRINELLQKQLGSENLSAFLTSYRPIVESYITKQPDSIYLPVENWQDPLGEFAQVYSNVGKSVLMNYQIYTNSLGWPMPVFLWHELVPEGWWFTWDASYQYQGHSIIYNFELSKTTAFNSSDIIYRKAVTNTDVTVPTLTAGTYFWRVVIQDATNPNVNWQLPFDTYWDENADRLYPGMRAIDVP